MRFFRSDAHPQYSRMRPGIFASALLLVTPLLLIGTSIDSSARNGGNGTAALRSAAGDGATITASGSGGYVRSLRTARGGRIAVPGAGAEARARAFMNRFGDAFVADAARLELATARVTERGGAKVSHVRFRQEVDGLPVRAAEAIVHLDDAGVTSATSNLLSSMEGVETSPAIAAGEALDSAAAVVARLGGAEASYSEPGLEIFSRDLLDGRGGDRAKLAWFVEATGPALREFIWVDAADGTVIHHFSQLTDVKAWMTYDSEYTDQLQKTLLRTDGDTDIPDADADNAHNFAGNSYDFFFQAFGRLSFDGADGTVISNVRFCPGNDGDPCGYENAFWDGIQLTYGEGFSAADDVVAHEFTHGVIEYSSNFLYQNQSGALSESYADIFGELTDQASPDGGNAWELAEDLAGGPERDMMTPTIYGQPGKISDSEYYCGTADNGGVHTNSGVGNHAFALASDGGTYNTVTVTGIGTAKAGEIFYEALTNYLGSTATWADNYTALNTACADIVTGGGGTNSIVTGDCTELQSALDAVEMDDPPCVLPTVTLCPAPQIPIYNFMDDLEDPNAGGWTLDLHGGLTLDHWGGGFGTPDIFWSDSPYSGSFSFWGYNWASEGDSSVAMDSSVTLPADASLVFYGDFSFEPVWDGGVVEYSTNDGSTWSDAAPLMAGGQMYNGALDPTNPLGARPAFTGAIGGYAPTLLDLGTLDGMSFRARFRIGTDIIVGEGDYFGWFVDDVAIFTCADPVQHDWDGDQKPDLFWHNDSNALTYLWYMDGVTMVQGAVMPTTSIDWVVGGIGDFDADGDMDILWRNTVTGDNTVWIMEGTTFVSALSLTARADQNWEIGAVADMNGDDIADVIWRNYSTGANEIWTLDAGLNETVVPVQPVPNTDWRIEALADFNGDGMPDIVWRNYAFGGNFIWYMNLGTFLGGAPVQTVPWTNWQIVQASDVNRDGQTDLIWRNYGAVPGETGRNHVWYMAGPLRIADEPLVIVSNTSWKIEN